MAEETEDEHRGDDGAGSSGAETARGPWERGADAALVADAPFVDEWTPRFSPVCTVYDQLDRIYRGRADGVLPVVAAEG